MMGQGNPEAPILVRIMYIMLNHTSEPTDQGIPIHFRLHFKFDGITQLKNELVWFSRIHLI